MPILIYESGKGVCIVRNASIIIPLPFNPNIVLHGSFEYEFIKLKNSVFEKIHNHSRDCNKSIPQMNTSCILE